MKRNELIAAALLAVLPAAPAVAQEAFPSRMLTIINPNAPGGTSDIIGHGMSEPLRQAFKQSVIMTSRVGAGGAVGGAFVAQAPADGYTVLLNTVTHVLIPITDNVLGRSSSYSVNDFVMPAKTPAAVVKIWQTALRESAQDPRFREAMTKINVTVDYLDGDALKAWYDNELKRLEREIRAIGKIEGRN